MSTPERAGWYDDPEDDSQLRYFDGIIWSDRTVPRQAPARQTTPQTDPSGPQDAPGTDVFGRPAAGAGTGTTTGPQWGPPTQQGHPHHDQRSGGWEQPAGPPPPTTPDGQPLAGYGARVGAYIIDLLILAVLNVIVTGWAWYLWMADYWSFVWDAAMAGDQDAVNDLQPEELLAFFEWRYLFIAMGLSLLLQAVYHVGFLATRSATPGKMAVGLSVRRVEHPGPLGVGTAFMRLLLPLAVGVLSMVPLLSYLVWMVSAVDLVWPIKDPRRQALHDKIAGTQVVVGKQPRRSVTPES